MKYSTTICAILTCGFASAFTTCSKPSFMQIAPKSFMQQPAFVIHPSINMRSSSVSPLFMSVEAIEEVTLDSEERMLKSIESVVTNLATIRTGRANASILDRVKVDYYGAPTPLNQLASISVASAQQLTVQPYDKSSLKDIEKGIIESDLGITPSNDGTVIRLNIPALTEDRRKDLLKQCKGLGEEGKVALRNIRRDGVEKLKKMEKASDISKDQSADGQDEMQKLIDKYTKEIDGLVAKKEKELMTV